MRGRGDRPGCGGGEPGGDVGLDRPGVAHPQDGAVGLLAGHTQEARRQGSHQHRHRRVDGSAASRYVHLEVLAVESDGVATQHGGDHRQVLLGVATRMGVGQTVGAFDGGQVRRPEAQGEPGTTHGRGHRDGAVGLEDGVAGVGLEDGGAQLDRGRGSARERDRHHRVSGDGAGVPDAGEPVGLGANGLVDQAVDRAGSPAQPDAHGAEASPVASYRRLGPRACPGSPRSGTGAASRARGVNVARLAGVAQWLESQPSKLVMRVRFPSPALV